MDRSRELHWQSAWARAELARARRDPAREKFYALVAYPGTSGFLHVGHLRGLAQVDAVHRYWRMRGRRVFFPTGAHASGLPAVTFAQKVQARDPTTVQQLRDSGVAESNWSGLEDPAAAARFLGKNYLAAFRRLGLLIDERAYVTTIDDDYQAFIRWQFRRLRGAGALVQKPHYAAVCPVCGPVSVDPSETDLSKGGEAETVVYTALAFELPDGRVLLAATLRPETLFGATNVWLAPASPLAVWHHAGRAYLVSPTAAHRLVEQHGGSVGHEVRPEELLGRTATVPLTGAQVPILASGLVDPGIGTGVVMSVPAHAPVDWLGLRELPEAERPRGPPPETVIEVPTPSGLSASEAELLSGDGPPAARACRATGAQRLADARALEAATERLYRLEFVRGRMRSDLLGGAAVPEARRDVTAQLLGSGRGFELREFSETVLCRNGHEVVIRRIPDQWFLRYSDAQWKATTRSLVGRMQVLPGEYGEELSGILDWFDDRPCVRRGRWLGTPFPLDPTWVIEPIADSTLYPAYFPIRPFVADGRLPVTALTDAFFDYVFLGEGVGEPTLPQALLDEVRAEFLYWYPLDVNAGGKEHKRVHFPVFLFTHALLLPPELRPRGLFVHWWLTDRGGSKISKKEVSSKGGRIPPLQDAFERWGADALRLFFAQAASAYQDIEWDPELVDTAAARLAEVERLVRDALGPGAGGPPELDRWLATETHDLVERVRAAFELFDLRAVAEEVYVRLPATVRRYVARGGAAGPALGAVAEAWVRLLSPITPHLAEELGEGRGRGLVAEREFPEPAAFRADPGARAAEAFVDRVEEDLRSVLRPRSAHGEPPEAVVFFVAAPWKRTVETWLREPPGGAQAAPPSVREVMERLAQHPELQAFRALVPRYVQRVAPLVRSEAPLGDPVDELAVLRSAEGYLARRFGFSAVQAFSEEEGEAHDPLGRRERARPGRPAIYLSGHRPPPSAASAGVNPG